MELPQLGKQCDNPMCKQLDILPLTCKCQKVFCAQHFSQHVADCPFASSSKEVQVDIKKTHSDPELFVCSKRGCKQTSLVPLICGKCNNHFCIAHRHLDVCEEVDPAVKASQIERMNEPVMKFAEAKAAVDKEIEEKLSNVSNKKAEMARKVHLIRLKSKAVGVKTIPMHDRAYFNIKQPVGSKDSAPPIAVFVSKAWSVGRAIDAIAAQLKMKNENNREGALKLRLFVLETGDIFSESVADKVCDVLTKGRIRDGENLILEYVRDDCAKINVNGFMYTCVLYRRRGTVWWLLGCSLRLVVPFLLAPAVSTAPVL